MMRSNYNYNPKRILTKKRNNLKIFKQRFHRYCEHTTLHGFRYITLRQSTFCETLFWIVICVLGVIFSVVLTMRMWSKFSQNPTVTTIDAMRPIWDLPFPSVTICNNNKVYKPRADEFTKIMLANGMNKTQIDDFFLSLLKLVRPERIKVDRMFARQVLRVLNLSVDKLMYQLRQPCSAMLVRCMWVGHVHDCDKIFKAVKSKEGYCCSFNYHFELSEEYEYSDKVQLDDSDSANVTKESNKEWDYPGVLNVQQSPGAGRDVGLAIALDVEPGYYKSSVRPFAGATILVHDSNDFPDVDVESATALPGYDLTIAITGTEIVSEEDVRLLPVNKRSCWFDDEAGTKKGRYSFQTCMSECVYDSIGRHCNCLPFYYPEPVDGKRICYLPDLHCILDHRENLSHRLSSVHSDCLCYVQCTDRSYDITTENVKIDLVAHKTELLRGLDLQNVSLMHVFFSESSYVKYRRRSMVTWDDLLASFGGIFGLCLGGSVMSIVEIIYLLFADLFIKKKTEKNVPVEQTRNRLPLLNRFPAPYSESRATRDSRERQSENRLFFVYNRNNQSHSDNIIRNRLSEIIN